MNDTEKKLLKGFRTIIVGLGIAVAPSALSYLAGVDWSFLGANGAFAVSGVIMVLMRFVTTTKVASKV